jgi:hypothetical protein
MDSLAFLGYGHGFQGQGVFARLVVGMTYLCDARILPRFFKIPTDTGSEDLAISYLVGRSKLYVCPTAQVSYTVCNTMTMLFNVRKRQLQEIYRLRIWLTNRFFLRLPKHRRNLPAYICCHYRARRSLARFAETRTLPNVIGFIQHLKEILSPRRFFAVTCLMFPFFTALKFIAYYNLTLGKTKSGWLPYRR